MRKIIFISIMLIIASIISIDAQANTKNTTVNNFSDPDFNFPQDVAKNAVAKLDSALFTGDGYIASQALIQYGLAKSMISSENLPEIISKTDSVISKEKNEVFKSFLQLIKARILSDYLNNNYFSLNDRNNINPSLPTNILEWDKEQFSSEIFKLLNNSLSNPDILFQIPITKYPKLITIDKNSISDYPSLLDFFVYEAKDIYNRINRKENPLPVFRAPQTDINVSPAKPAYIQSLYDILLKYHPDGSIPYIKTLIAGNSTKDLQYWKSLYAKYSGNPNSAPILLKEIENIPEGNKTPALREKYSLLSNYLSEFSDSQYIPIIKNALLSLQDKSLSINYKEQFSSLDSITVDVRNYNIESFKIYIFDASHIGSKYVESKDLKKILTSAPIFTKEYTSNEQIPFNSEQTIKLPPLPFGKYILIGDFDDSSKNSLVDKNSNRYIESFIVSDFSYFFIGEKNKDGNNIIIANSFTGKPEKKVTANFTTKDDKVKKHFSVVSDKNGFAEIPYYREYDFNLRKDKDIHLSSNIYAYPFYMNDNDEVNERIELFTDLAIYRPGDTVHLAGIVYSTTTSKKQVLPNKKYNITFNDADNDSIAHVSVITDEMGRFNQDFIIPKDRMNGEFSFELYNDGDAVASKNIIVSEYKAPTFYIEFVDAKQTYSPDGMATITGRALSYTKIPQANIPISIEIGKSEWYNDFNEIASTSIFTDEKGFFTVTFDTSILKKNNDNDNSEDNWFRYIPFYLYQLKATGTDKAGDTQSASTSFTIGSSLQIKWSSNGSFNANADNTVNLPVSITDYESSTPKDYTCDYEIFNKDKESVSKGSFSSMNPAISLRSIASGAYYIKISLRDNKDVSTKPEDITIYRLSDKKAPIETAIWTPSGNLSFAPGAKASIQLASYYPNTYVYYVVNYQNSILKQGWTNIDGGFNKIEFTMPSGAHPSDVIVQVCAFRNGNKYQSEIRISPIINEPMAILSVESFRNKISASSEEKWTIHLTIDGKPTPGAAIICEMYDKAINSLANNVWSFHPSLIQLYTASHLFQVSDIPNNDFYSHFTNKKLPYYYSTYPTLYLFDQSFFSSSVRIRMYKMNIMDTAVESAPAEFKEREHLNEVMVRGTSSITMQGAAQGLNVSASQTTKQMESIKMRTDQVRTALWKPTLTTDANGNAILEFTTPNFNTTWLLQAISYNKDLVAASFLKEVVSTKPIMVKPNMPRFLRQGDITTLYASVQNATDSVQNCKVIVDLFNPIDNEIYSSKEYALSLAPMSSDSVSINCNVPDSVTMIGYRIKASNGYSGDGEQVSIPVLQAISPVIESVPFYIEAGEKNYSIKLPKFPKGARVTFEYCNNPIWYCITALPAIWDDDNPTASSAAHSLFATLVAQHVATTNPSIKEAVEYWENNPQDSTLISMLEKNQDLKIGTLLASPWIKDSQEQTLRMQQISQLFNEDLMSRKIDAIVKKLTDLQMPDGGWTWYRYNGSESSLFTTMEVLQLLGKAKELNALPNDRKDINEMLVNGVKYLDKELIEIYNMQKDKLDFTGFSDFAYTRSFFPEIQKSITVNGLYQKIFTAMRSEWRQMNAAGKAFTAITLSKNAETKTAETIIESLRQFSITKPASGMYWDNLQVGWYRYYNKVAITSILLEAFNKVEPTNKDIDQIRKWLLLEKQTTDWGSSSMASDAVYAILSSGSKWLQRAVKPKFTLGTHPFEFNKLDKILGYGKRQINVAETNTASDIDITRNASGPAWGAVYCQYSAPMSSVKAASIPELSITKEFIVYPDGINNTTGKNLKVGDKVQIRLTITNSRNLEYVTLADERAACFEPVNQVSSYQYLDGMGYYMEVKDSKTNLFFNYIPKGTHIITYDLYVTNPGKFNSGIVTIQCQYAPQMVAHSAGNIITVK